MKTTILKETLSEKLQIKARRVITTILGITLAISGMHHGFFEILQGNTSTGKMFIDSIGEAQRMWPNGSDGAFTLIPNFLITGIAAILVSTAIIWWTLFYIDKKHGPVIFLILFVILTLTGGGIGHIPFYILTWLYARKMNTENHRWIKALPLKVRKMLSKTWLSATIVTASFFIIGLEISVFGYVPGMYDPDKILIICWSFLFVALFLINYSYIAGIAYDIDNKVIKK
ncbi:MAG: hypothetical protein JXJ22_18030 [Bacteroidales bacterium]|nr:hypothetical protein [Bacteroidales bacterium]